MGILLTLALILGLVPGMSLTAYADGHNAYADYDVTTDVNKDKSGDALTALQVTFNGMQWYIIANNSTAVNAGTVTLLAADTSFGTSVFYPESSESSMSNSYNSSTVKGYLDSIVAGTAGDGKPNFAGVADAIQPVTLTTYKYKSTTEVAETTENAKLYLLSKEEAESLPANVRQFKFYFDSANCWWLRSPGSKNYLAMVVENQSDDIHEFTVGAAWGALGVRPALKLNLSSVIFSSQSNTFSLKHTHSFTYAADGATITATCTADGCTLPPSTDGGSDHVATLTISANGGTYNGTTAYGATITDIYGIKGDAKVKYQKKTSESTYDTATETVPIDVGDYKASITLGEATASVEYSIGTPYPVWVGGVQVTSVNQDDVLGDMDTGATVKFTPETDSTSATLTLNGANITNGSYYNAAIYAHGDLTIEVTQDSTVTGPSFGVFVYYGSVTVNGTLNATGGEANGLSYGVVARGNVTVNGTLNAKGGESKDNSYGVVATGNVTVNDNSVMIATGNTQAISGTVKNAITGIGWTNTAGTEGKADIAIKNDGQSLTYKKVQFPAHGHDFIYSATGATITATCANTDECYLPKIEGIPTTTLTIAAEGGTYDGTTAYGATITDLYGIQGDAKIQYQKKTGESTYDTATETAPTDAGDYKASITLGEGNGAATASVEYTIAKADPTANAPTGLTATFGQTLADVSLTNPQGNTEGAWAWVDTGATSVGDAGSHTFKANFTPSDTTNYNTVSDVDVAVTVSKANATTEMQAAAVSIEARNGETATVSYTLPDGASYGDVSNSNTDFFSVSKDNGLVLTAAKDWTASEWATGAPKTFTIPVTGATNYNDYTLTVSVTPTYHQHNFSYSASGATITATCDNTDTKCPLTDNKATLTLSAANATYTGSAYTGASFSDTTAWTGAGLTAPTIEYAGRGNTSYTKSEAAPTNAGTYTASITVDTAIATADFTISPMALTITGATATNRAYDKDSTAVMITAVTFKDSSDQPVTLTPGEDKDYTVTGAMIDANAGDGKNVNVTVTLRNTNYSLATSTTSTTVSISKATAQTIADVTDSQVYTLTSISKSVADKMPADAGELTYTKGNASTTGSVTVSDFTVNATSGAVTATLSGGAAGDTVTLPVTISSTNYANSTANVKITLTAKGDAGVDITGVPTSKTYGDTDFTLTGSVTDAGTGTGAWTWSTSDTSVFQITPNGATATVRILKAGSATITAGYESDTTVGTKTTVTITVNTKTLTIAVKDQNIYVDGMVPDLSSPVLDTHYTVSGLVGEETLTSNPTLSYRKNGEPSTPDNTRAGTYDIVPSGAAASENYTISYTNGTLTITEKEAQTITADNVAAVYGDTDKKVSATTNGNGAISYAVKDGSADYIDVDASTGALTIKKIGTATVVVTAAETDTCEQATKDVTVTINKASSVPATVTANNRTYDGTEKPLVTVTGETTSGTMYYAVTTENKTPADNLYTTSIPSKTDAGIYYVWYKVKGDASHIDTKPVCIQVTIAENETYAYTSGADSMWTKSSWISLYFEIKNSGDDTKIYDKFKGAKVDGKPLTKDKDFTAYSGSVIIELKPTYLETLSVGEHTLTAEFTDGTAEAKFTVAKGAPVNLPQTGDSSNVFVHVLIGFIALSGLGLIIKKRF